MKPMNLTNLQKHLAGLLAALMALCALAACAPAAKDGADSAAPAIEMIQTGKYIESEIELPLPEGFSEQMVIGAYEEGDALVVFTATNLGEAQNWQYQYFRHTVLADGTVATAAETWLNDLSPYGGNEMRVIKGSDGGIYMSFSDFDEKYNLLAHLLVSRDGGKSGAEIVNADITKVGTITSFGVFEDGSIAAANFYDGSLALFDAAGNKQTELEAGGKGNINACAANGKYAAFTVPENNTVRVYNRADETYRDYEFAFPEDSSAQLAVDGEGTVYLADRGGLYRHTNGGTLWEKLVEGGTSSLGLPSFYVGFILATDDSPYPKLYVDGTEGLLRYSFDPTASAVADKKISVFSLSASDAVQQAIVAFSRVRADVAVNYTVAMESGASGATQEDFIKALNTELLAGTGPDVLILDGLPIDSYIEKGVLADLTALVAGAEPMLENISETYAADGRLYAVPTGFRLPFAVTGKVSPSAYDSLSALADAAEAAGEPKLLSNCAFSYQTLALYLLKYYGGALYAGDTAAIRPFLTDAARVSRAIGSTAVLGEGWDEVRDWPEDEAYDLFANYTGTPQLMMVISGKAQDILMQPIGNVRELMEPAAAAEKLGADIVSVNGQYVPKGIVGINGASAEPEAAEAFVKTLLSYSAQGGNRFADAFPVNAQALTEALEYENDGVSSGFMLPDGTEFSSEWPKKVWRERLGELIATLDTPILEDAALSERFLTETAAFLDGSSTLDEAEERMASLLATYLSE